MGSKTKGEEQKEGKERKVKEGREEMELREFVPVMIYKRRRLYIGL